MEPGRKQNQDTEPDFRPDLRAIQGGGETTDRSRDHLRIVPNDETEQKRRNLQAAENSNSLHSDGSAQDKEQNPAAPVTTIPSTFGTQQKGGKSKLTGRFNWRKNSTIGGIVVFLLGILGIGTTLFTPGLGVIQMKEVLTRDLNDQVAAMDIRSNHMFRAKLSNMSSGVCTGVEIRCKFSSMNQRQVDRFKKAGFIINDDQVKETLFGRKKIVSMTAPDGTVINNPADLTRARSASPQVRSAMNRVFNPLYYSVSDKVANTFLLKNKTGKQKKVTGTDPEEQRKALKEATAGEKANNSAVLKDSRGNYIIDSDGNRVYDTGDTATRFNELKAEADRNNESLNDKPKVNGKALGSVLGAGALGVSVIGVSDSACTVYNTARAVSAAAKIARSMQLIQFAMVINTTADSIKAGDAAPEEVEFIGTMLASTDTRQKVIDETTNQEIDNIFYQKSAYDSPGFKTASYNDAPVLTPQSQQYMVGGGLSGNLKSVLSGIEQDIGGGNPEALRSSCGFIQSPWVRGAGLIAGVFLAIGSFGIGTAVSIAGSVAVAFSLPFLEAALADIVAGNVIGENIAGVEAGDAAFAGSAALFGGIAQNRGMTPLNKEGIQGYITATAESKSDMIAAEKYEASQKPFDITNQYSFIGSFARTLNPIAINAKGSVSSAVISVGSVLKQAASSLTGKASAATAYNEARFSQCNDPGYEELGINADIFCNVRYGLTSAELELDPLVVVDFMLNNGYITEDGTPQKEYAEFVEKCALRQDGWGETSEENGSIGKECLDSTTSWDAISYFRVFTMDESLSTAMDGDVAPGETEEETGAVPNAGRPENVRDAGKGWTTIPGTDYSNVQCDPRTEDRGVITKPNGTKLRLCNVNSPQYPAFTTGNEYSVASIVSTNVVNMFEAAYAAGHQIGISNSMRINGATQHGYGVAMDLGAPRGGATLCFDSGAPSGSKRGWIRCSEGTGPQPEAFQWLRQNGPTYGFYAMEGTPYYEPWHWSTSGM